MAHSIKAADIKCWRYGQNWNSLTFTQKKLTKINVFIMHIHDDAIKEMILKTINIYN